MPRMIGNIPNFINGVSQQPDALRLASQGKEQRNCYSTVAKGLIGRPALEVVAKISDSQSDRAFTHTINRDQSERYHVIYDEAHSDVNPNLMLNADTIFTIANWTASSGAILTNTEHSTDDPSYNYKSNFRRTTFDGTPGESISQSGHTAVGVGGEDVVWTVWLRLKTDVTLTDVTNVISLAGARMAAPVTASINTLVYNVWQKFYVTGAIAASPTTDPIEMSIVCGEAVDIDLGRCQLEYGTVPTLTCPGSESTKIKLKVFDFAGVERQVWYPNGDAYLVSPNDPATDLKALTVADRSYIINKEVVCAKGSTVSDSAPKEVLIVVRTPQPGIALAIHIDGIVAASHTISDTDPTELGTESVGAALLTDLIANGYNTGDWTAIRPQKHADVILITNVAGDDFTCTVQDGSSGLGIYPIKHAVQTFSEVPRSAPTGYKIEVKGDVASSNGAYWVEFTGVSGDSPIWEETVGFDVPLDMDDTTLPHELISLDQGVFSFITTVFAQRTVGDVETNPWPSFIGEKINDIFFHKSRLSVLAGENVILAETRVPENFFRTTVTKLIDSDPIDVGSDHTKISILRHAVPFQEQLLLFSELTQFKLTQGEVLSPNSVGLDALTEFDNSKIAEPTVVGNFVFFAVEKSSFAAVREYFTNSDNSQKDSREITGHVTEYIPSGIDYVRGTSNEDVLLVRSGNDPVNVLRVYKYFWSGRDKVQSSWSYWDFPDVTRILGYSFINSSVYFVLKRADGVFLEKMELDTGYEDGSGTGFNLRADRKVFSTDASVSAVYDSGTDKTTYTFENHVWKSVPLVVGVLGNSVDNPIGRSMPIDGLPTTYDSNEIVLEGDTTADDFCFGLPYECEYDLSRLVMKVPATNGGGEVPITEGRLQIMWLTLRYADTGYLEVIVTPQGRTPRTYSFNGRTIGSSEDPMGTIPIDEDGKIRVPIFSRSDRVEIKVRSSDALPFQLISADFIGNQVTKFPRK